MLCHLHALSCFMDYFGYFCRYWGSDEVQDKTDVKNDNYMMCLSRGILANTSRATSTVTTQVAVSSGACDSGNANTLPDIVSMGLGA